MQKFEVYDHRRKAAVFAEILESLDKALADPREIEQILTPREYLIDSWYSASLRRRNDDTRYRYHERPFRRPGGAGGMNIGNTLDKED